MGFISKFELLRRRFLGGNLENGAELQNPEIAPSSGAEVRYRCHFQAIREGLLILNASTIQVEDANLCLAQMLGYTREALLGKKFWDIDAFKDSQLSEEIFSNLQEKEYIRYENLPLQMQDGRRILVELSLHTYDCDGLAMIACEFRNITTRVMAHAALRAGARAFKVVQDGHSTLLQVSDKQKILGEVCRVIVETGGYRMAWIAFAKDGHQKYVQPLAQYGDMHGSLVLAPIAWAETTYGRGPTLTAIRTGEIQHVENISTDPSMAPWRTAAARFGYASVIALPIQHSANLRGCLTIYGSTPGTLPVEDYVILQELANDLAHEIVVMRTFGANRYSQIFPKRPGHQLIQ